MTWRPISFALLLLGACGEIPKDPNGTLERIRVEKSFRVGLIASGRERAQAPRQKKMLDRLAAAVGASPLIEEDAAEPLLARLETGDLDLVIGELAPKSPWEKRVTVIPQLGEQVTPKGHVHVVVAARHGENAWISFLHREARAIAAAP